MKKVFKGLAVLAASTALCAGIGVAAGCSGGKNGTYVGSYNYVNDHKANYGIMVKVTVKNNVITKVVDITNTDLSKQGGWSKDENKMVDSGIEWTTVSAAMPAYGWTDEAVKNWTDNECWLLQQYEGLTVKEVKNMDVNIKNNGEPYNKDKNGGFNDLLITGSTQGSGRVLLAVKNALGEKKEIGRIENPKA